MRQKFATKTTAPAMQLFDTAKEPIRTDAAYMFENVPVVGTYSYQTMLKALKKLYRFGIFTEQDLKSAITPDKIIRALETLPDELTADEFAQIYQEVNGEYIDPVAFSSDWQTRYVTIGDGHVYGEDTATQLLKSGNPLSPLTRKPIRNNHIWYHPIMEKIRSHFMNSKEPKEPKEPLRLNQLFHQYELPAPSPYGIISKHGVNKRVYTLNIMLSVLLLTNFFGNQLFSPFLQENYGQDPFFWGIVKLFQSNLTKNYLRLLASYHYLRYALNTSSKEHLVVCFTLFSLISGHCEQITLNQIESEASVYKTENLWHTVAFPFLQIYAGTSLILSNPSLTNPFRHEIYLPLAGTIGLSLMTYAGSRSSSELENIVHTLGESTWLYMLLHFLTEHLSNHAQFGQQLKAFIIPVLMLGLLCYDEDMGLLFGLANLISSLIQIFSTPLCEYFSNEHDDGYASQVERHVFSLFRRNESEATPSLRKEYAFEQLS